MKHEQLKGRLVKAMANFFEYDYRRITHAIEVLKYAEQIVVNYPEADEEVVIASAIFHDVGIKPSEAELGYNNGKTQEYYGPPIAITLLKENDFPAEKIEKVAQIVGNHHSASGYDYVELEILKTADRIVNKLDAEQ